jgi:hypothetical protein
MVAETAIAQTVIIGVTKGDAFDYSYNLLWESTTPSATPPAEYVEMNNTQSFRLSITDVSGYLVSVETTLHFKNGTERTQNGTVDTYHQSISVPYGFLLIRANSNPNEKIYPDGSDAAINETVSRTYSNGEKETSHYVTEITGANRYEKTEIYFDRATGVALESYYENRETSGSYSTTIKETITLEGSGVTAAPLEFPLYVVVPVVIIVAAVFAILLVKRRRKPSAPKAEQDIDEDEEDEPEEEGNENQYGRW